MRARESGGRSRECFSIASFSCLPHAAPIDSNGESPSDDFRLGGKEGNYALSEGNQITLVSRL